MRENIPKMGVVTVAQAVKYPIEQRGDIKILLSKLKKEDVRISLIPDFVDSIEKASEANSYLREENIDILLLQIGGYIPDEIAARIVESIKVPLFLWVVPESLDNGNIATGSVVGFMQSGGVISKLGKKFEILFGDPKDEKIIKRLDLTIKTIGTVKKLRNSKIGMLGYHCPGMLDASFHELELKNIIGSEIVYIDIANFIKTSEKISINSCEKIFSEINDKVNKIDGPTRNDIIEAVRLYLTLKKLVEVYSLSAIAVRCWPEFKELGIISPCLALSMLTNDGVVASCEGDVLGAVSMQILHYLSGNAPFFFDVLKLVKEDNVFMGFHCGAAAPGLAENKSNINLRTHFRVDKPVEEWTWKPGVTVEFPIKPGRVTLARLDEIKGTYRMAVMGGEAQRTDMFVRGNCVKVRMDRDVEEILKILVSEGFGHHQILVHSDIVKELSIVCKLLGIQFLEI